MITSLKKLYEYSRRFIVSFLIQFLTISAYSQTNLSFSVDSSATDFSDGLFENTYIINGDISIAPPERKITNAYKDNSLLREVYYLPNGDYLKIIGADFWSSDEKFFVQKYNAQGDSLSKKIRVNEDKYKHSRNSRMAIHQSGDFAIIWESHDRKYEAIAQFFDSNMNKIGENIRLNLEDNSVQTNLNPYIFWNKIDECYWMFYSLGSFDGGKNIAIKKFDKIGNQVGEQFYLNPETTLKYEAVESVSQSIGNDFVVSFNGSKEPVSSYSDIYLKHFSKNNEPDSDVIKVNDDTGSKMQVQSCVKWNSSDGYLVVWLDERNASEEGAYNVYGQFFKSPFTKIHKNYMINSLNSNFAYLPEILANEDTLTVSWLSWNSKARIYNTYAAKWYLNTSMSGSYISSVIDTKSEGTKYDKIWWENENIDSTRIRFQLRSANSLSALYNEDWYGPTALNEFYSDQTVKTINRVHNGHRFIQYKAIFQSGDITKNPILKAVKISYIKNQIPKKIVLLQNYPNPFNQFTTIPFLVPYKMQVSLSVYTIHGEFIKEIFKNELHADKYLIPFNFGHLASGIYVYVIKGSHFMATQKMVLVK